MIWRDRWTRNYLCWKIPQPHRGTMERFGDNRMYYSVVLYHSWFDLRQYCWPCFHCSPVLCFLRLPIMKANTSDSPSHTSSSVWQLLRTEPRWVSAAAPSSLVMFFCPSFCFVWSLFGPVDHFIITQCGWHSWYCPFPENGRRNINFTLLCFYPTTFFSTKNFLMWVRVLLTITVFSPPTSINPHCQILSQFKKLQM